MAIGAWAHNFPASKDAHPEYVNYPTAGWDTLIAAMFHDVFTALDDMQDALGYDITGAFADLDTRLQQLDHATLAHGFYDRGDPAGYDKDVGDFTKDGGWHDWDLSSIVPVNAVAVLLSGELQGAAVDWHISFRKKGHTNNINVCDMETLRAGVERHRDSIVACDGSRVIQYNADNQAWTTLSVVVRGWWIR